MSAKINSFWITDRQEKNPNSFFITCTFSYTVKNIGIIYVWLMITQNCTTSVSDMHFLSSLMDDIPLVRETKWKIKWRGKIERVMEWYTESEPLPFSWNLSDSWLHSYCDPHMEEKIRETGEVIAEESNSEKRRQAANNVLWDRSFSRSDRKESLKCMLNSVSIL